jgi:hypothetical protein
MNPRPIYLDTNLWNKLLDQRADPMTLLSRLDRSGASLALSGQTVYELGRTFQSSRERGKELFEYLKTYVDAGIIGAYDNMVLLKAEVDTLYADGGSVIAYYSPADYVALVAEVAKLANGIVDNRAQAFVSNRVASARTLRTNQKALFMSRPDMRAVLLAVPQKGLAVWLNEQMLGDAGATLLTGHLIDVYRSTDRDAAYSTAQGLLGHKASRIAKSIVRADLFSAWRCARAGSSPRDLADDLYHVLNASYCDVYATADTGQMEYASLILSQWTKPAIYDASKPLADWLLTL